MDKLPFAGMGQDETLQTIAYLLAAILEKLPRVDANDRVIVNASEIAPATTPVSGSLTAVTTVSAVSSIQALGTNSSPTNAVPMHIANAGANFLYDRIIFS